MDSIRHPVPRDAIMERLHYEPQFWNPKAAGRFKRHLPAIPKRKGKDSTRKSDHFEIVPAYPKHSKDKYGSVSAHSTSAIYGALRAPHYHAIYGPTDMWYASVRSLNRGIHRDVVYSAEAYEWRETLYQESAKDVFAVGPKVEMIPRPACMCMIRRRHPHEAPKSSRLLPRCKVCAPVPIDGAANGISSLAKRGISEKIKSSITSKEKPEPEIESTSRMSSYKKCITGSKYKNPIFKGMTAKDSRRISRKSILECDVTAYDLIKEIAKTQTISEIDDSDVDDNLSDNAVAKMNQSGRLNYDNKLKSVPSSSNSSRQAENKTYSSKFKKPQSENCIYGESHSVLVGGQRIFTENHRSKSPDLSFNLHPVEEADDLNLNSGGAQWKNMSESDESVCIPDPDYDFSDSDDSTVINSNCMDPKFTYSPPPMRKSVNDPLSGLGYSSRELSKSMSSLQSDDTFIPTVNVNKPNPYNWVSYLQNCDAVETEIDENNSSKDGLDENVHYDEVSTPSNLLISKPDSKYESSSASDCSSNGGTVNSDYPTWTSSSSNELKSILKKKKRRENAIQELEDASKALHYLDESKDSHRKKQVQFRPGCSSTATEYTNRTEDIDGDSVISHTSRCDGDIESKNYSSVINNTYETLDEVQNDKCFLNQIDVIEKELGAGKGDYISINNPFTVDELTSADCNKESFSLPVPSIKDTLNSNSNISETPVSNSQPFKLLSGRCNSYEDVRATKEDKECKSKNRRRRTTLPKRRFSDLHLHLLLCPTKSSFCGNGSSGEDLPLTQRAHRSLPESPSELDNVPSFCFDFLEKNTKDKVLSSSRSVFYVPVDCESPKCDSCDKNPEPGISLPSPSVDTSSNQNLEKSELVDMDDNFGTELCDTDDDNLENDYENLDPIYEELCQVSNSKRILSTDCEQKSFFEGASKTDILSYLADAKERGLTTDGLSEDEKIIIEEEDEDEKVFSDEDTIEKSRVITNNSINHKEVLLKIEEDIETEKIPDSETTEAEISKNSRISEVERNDSGVGTETSKPPRLQLLPADWEEQLCADCDHQVEPVEDEDSGLLFSPLVCRKCEFRRSERKEIIIEFVDTEFKYGRDLRIIKEEFYRPMEIAGLLAKDQLLSIFLNLDELTAVNTKFSEKLQDALDIAMEHGDEDYTNVNIGKIFLETSSMLHAFETYCVKQASASVLLSNLEKEKELLRIFLRVSQMENTLLRRMNLPAFLMVPVQRVTRYPLLLSRLHKVTPIHHKDRNSLKEAQQKVELHLEHINQQTKGVGGTKIWRRISNISASHRRFGKDIGSIKLRKMALEVLNWKQDEARFVIAGKLLFTQITDYPWNKKGKTVKFTPLHALLVALGKPNSNYRPDSLTSDNMVLFPRNTGIKDASLVLMKEKNRRFVVIRDPLYLGNCVISCEAETDVFEIQEYTTKEAYLLKGETKKDTKEWLRQLRYHAKDLGSWRKRRNALANIMINGMIRQ